MRLLSQVTAAREARERAEEERAAGVVLASALAKAPRPPPRLLHPSQPSSPPRRGLARLASSTPCSPAQPVVALTVLSPEKAGCRPQLAVEGAATAMPAAPHCSEVGSPVPGEETLHSEQSTW